MHTLVPNSILKHFLLYEIEFSETATGPHQDVDNTEEFE